MTLLLTGDGTRIVFNITRNLFVLYFGGWTLQKKFLSNKTRVIWVWVLGIYTLQGTITYRPIADVEPTDAGTLHKPLRCRQNARSDNSSCTSVLMLPISPTDRTAPKSQYCDWWDRDIVVELKELRFEMRVRCNTSLSRWCYSGLHVWLSPRYLWPKKLDCIQVVAQWIANDVLRPIPDASLGWSQSSGRTSTPTKLERQKIVRLKSAGWEGIC